MRWFLKVIFVCLPGLAVAQQNECNSGSAEVLDVAQWSAEEIKRDYGSSTKIEVHLSNQTESEFRMVEGRVYFEDVLGRDIANIVIDPDARIAAVGSYIQEGHYSGGVDIGRLTRVSNDDILVRVCVQATVDGDGNVARY